MNFFKRFVNSIITKIQKGVERFFVLNYKTCDGTCGKGHEWLGEWICRGCGKPADISNQDIAKGK